MSTDGVARPSLARVRGALTATEWRRAARLGAAVLGLHVVGLLLLIVLVTRSGAPEALGLGVGTTAYTLGLRHALDADHLAAIDGTTRKLIADGRRPLSVGLWFSLGHSSVVFVLAVLVWIGTHGVGGAVRDDDSTMHQLVGTIGPAVSGGLLVLIGLVNLTILVGMARAYRHARRDRDGEQALAERLERGGALTRVFGRLTRAVRSPWQVYPLGMLFGLGFDTATEIALLALAGGAAASDVPLVAMLCLPILFAAGMSLLDTIDGILMSAVFRQALVRPTRRARYNLAITALSVVFALLIGGAELIAVLTESAGLSGGVWDAVAGADLNLLGYTIAAAFLATWVVTAGARRVGRSRARV